MSLADGSTVAYNPRRLQGVNVFREVEREFALGDRVQFTAPNKQLGVANRDLGTIVGFLDSQVTLRMDGKSARIVTVDPREFRQFDHGYAVTSHSSQGLTADRVLANVDLNSHPGLINSRLAYVAILIDAQDARIYTNDAEHLGERLASEINKSAALLPTIAADFRAKSLPSMTRTLDRPFASLDKELPGLSL